MTTDCVESNEATGPSTEFFDYHYSQGYPKYGKVEKNNSEEEIQKPYSIFFNEMQL